ncbi:MAG: 4a-hydroxytetrahydrobiopterin dehydratase [Nocardioidaceae bacterium]|nr:4a-hydroxytetrahydrobiopterin dehydratase [Nocardioidaceae bacterium]MCL2615174.1 4a-hydroxytetrahydrobiopterin dehydratase [Nocardioidaceae bacterium]
MDPKALLSGDQVAEMDLPDWRSMYGALEARFATGDFATGLRLVERIGAAAEAANHHPDVTLTYPSVHVLLTSHDVGGKTQRDVDLARQISGFAAEMGVEAQPASVQRAEIGLDTADREEIKPFWKAVLAMEDDPRDDDAIIDPDGVTPTLWFQETDPHEEPRQRFHLDLRVPPEVARERIEAAVAAGGRVVDDGPAPRFVVLADAQGNKVCVCTHVGRSH